MTLLFHINIVCLYSLSFTVKYDVNLQVLNCSVFFMCCILKAIQYNLLKVRNIEVKLIKYAKISYRQISEMRKNFL